MPTPLADLFDGPLGSLFRDIADRFTTDGVTSAPFAGGVQHSGTLSSVQTDPIDLGFGELELPGITAGVPFRLAEFDAPDGHWHLDIVLDGLSLKLRDLHGADFIKEAGTTPRRLVRRATDTAVVISGEATIRFLKTSDNAPVILLFVENRSASDPLAETGAVVNLRCTPQHFFFGTSQFGMTLAELLFDASKTFSPGFVIGQGQTAEWIGFAVAEATFYAPPNAIGRGGFSGGVRNLLIGSPRGVQGEFEIQWGRAPLDPTTFRFTQAGQPQTGAIGSGNALLVPITGGQDDAVAMTAAFVASQPPEGGAVTDWGATWRWPDGSETSGDSASGTVRHGQVLRVTPEERITGRPVVRHPEVTFRFVAAGEVPEIDVITAGTSVVNAVHVAGPKAEIAALSFRARSTAPAAGTFRWKVEPNGTERTGTSVQIPESEIDGDRYLVLRETDASGHARVARIRLQPVEGATLLVGGEDGVVAAASPTSPLTPAAVEGTYDLPDYHARARFTSILDDAELDPSRPERVMVPSGGLALVTISSGGVPPTVEHDRHVEILFEFATGRALRWGADRPAGVGQGGDEAGLQRQLLEWAANYPGADFLVVGRCDDLGSDSLNATLARTRRDTVLRFLTTVPPGSGLAAVPTARITGWGEQDGQPGSVAISPLDDEEKAAQRLVLATDASGDPLTDRSDWISGASASTEPRREPFRRVDIYAVGGTPAAGAVRRETDPGRAPDLRRMLMPGETVDPVPAPVTTPAFDYRVKLLAAWDKPTGDGWKDLIPSKAEFEYAWSPDDQPLPNLGGQPVTLEVLTVYGSWRHDDASGFTRAQVGIRSDGDPDGLIRIDQPNLVAALALGPVLLSGVDSTTDTVETGARIAALAAGVAFAQTNLGGSGPLIGAGSKAAIKKLEATAEIKDVDDVGDDYKISLTSDYTTTLHVNTGALGLKTHPDQPAKIRYKDVGIVFDQSESDIWEKIALAYPTDALSIEDPGRWQIDGVLGQLLRAVETALGQGSVWIETRFAFALSIGVVEVSEAIVRVTFVGSTPSFSLRGLVAKIDVPATVKGEGRLRIEDPGGVIKAGIDLEVIPLKLKASAAFAMAQVTTPEPFTFVNLYAKVQFPVGIPLGPSGAALHGFIGQTVINGTRDVIASTDIVAREIGWWRKNPEDKYKPLKDQHALGIGAVVGTLPDASFSLSATGMIVVAFPDPEVIFAVEISLLSVPDRTPKEKKDGQSASITGLIVIDDQAVALAAQARYEIPQVLKVTVPFAAYFPYSGVGTYVRIGSDGQEGRSGEPVTLTLLPSTLNLQAWSYLMIEQDGLPKLGGDPRFSFQGFSVGFGAGAGLEWKAGPIRLSASIKLLAGMGTDPLLIKAGIFVKGELDLVVISVSARGEILLTYQDSRIWMDGEFCGEVDLFFFSLKGCVSFRIGSDMTGAPPPPLPPVASIFLTDRGGRVMGEALRDGTGTLKALPIFDFVQVDDKVENRGVAPSGNHTVWADTLPQINFRHYIIDAEAGPRQFARDGQYSGGIWFGSNRLKYAYQLDGVRLVRDSDGAPVTGPNPLKAGWQTSPARPPGSAGPALPSGAETLSLKLLDWQPWGWALPMADGGESAPGDPAGTVGTLCDPVPPPARACLFGRDARGFGPDRIRLFHETPPPGPYPSWFTLAGRPGLRVGATVLEGPALAGLIASAGALPLPGAVVTLSQPVAGPQGPLQQGYRLPAVQLATPGQVATTTLPWLAEFDRTIRRGSVLLLVCGGRGGPGTGTPNDCYRFAGLPIGKQFAALEVPRFKLEAMRPERPFTVTDRVDLTHSGGVLGTDRQPDILIAEPGLVIRPTAPTRSIELHFFRGGPLTASVKWSDAAGNSDAIAFEPAEQGAKTVRIDAPADLAEIAIRAKGGLLFLTEICTPEGDRGRICFDFGKVSRRALAQGRFVHGGVTFTVLDPAIGFGLIDAVDARPTPATRGTDAVPELRFPEKGVELRMAEAWDAVELGVWSGGGPIVAVGLDARGNVVDQARADARDPVELHLQGPGIVRVTVSGGSNEAVLNRVCRRRQVDAGDCVTFGDKVERGLKTLERGGLTFTPRSDGDSLTLADVARADEPVRAEPDGMVELIVPPKGLAIATGTPRTGLTLFVLALADARVQAVAFDAAGAKVATAIGGGAGDTLARLALEGAGIVRVELTARGRAALTRVCSEGPQLGLLARAATNTGLPIVSTRLGQQVHRWPGTVIGTVVSQDGRACRVMRFDQPATVRDAPGFDIVTPAGLGVTLLSVCGVDTAADAAQAQDAAAQADLGATVGGASNADPTVAAREVLLEPGETYRVEVDWSWQAWQSNPAGTDAPGAPVAAAWQAGPREVFRFRVASEELAASGTQDGLNEFKFDPRDLVRYLGRTEPADGRDVVFTDDPLWVHFSAGHVEALVDRYGRELVLEVRRTDPPPQPDQASMDLAVFPLLIEILKVKGVQSVLSVAEQRINQAVLDAPCLPDAPAVGGQSIGGRWKLAPNAMYDFNLLAVRKGAPPAARDPIVVNATRFKTSRYATPAAMLDAMGFATAGTAPLPPEELLLGDAMTLPTGALSVSDRDMADALAAIGADTLPLPGDRPRAITLWRRVGGSYRIVGFLLDSPEPMRREAAVVVGNAAVDSVRCEPDRLLVGGTAFLPVRATLNWTRVLFATASPAAPTDEAELALRLRVAPGGTLTGRRTLRARPLMLDTEGF
jgi:hypothetical protein